MSQKALIELTEIEPRQSITHYKICSWNFEVPRPSLSKEGFIDIWLAKCYLIDDIYYESQEPGINIKIEGEDFTTLCSIPTTIKDLMTDSMEILSTFLINHGYLEGIVVLIHGD